MTKPIKMVLAGVSSLLALLVVAVITAAWAFNPNDYRKQLAEAVTGQTGRSFAVGHIGLEVFPWLKLNLAQVQLGNASGFGPTPMLSAAEIKLGVKLWPLLTRRQIVASALSASGLNIELALDAQGRSNWADLLARQQQPSPKPADHGPSKALQDFSIEGLQLSKTALHYQDARSGADYQLQNLALSTGPVRANQPVMLNGEAAFAATQPAISGSTTFSTEVRYALASGDLSLKGLVLGLKAALPPPANGQPLAFDVQLSSPALQWQPALQTLSAPALALTINQLLRGVEAAPVLLAKGQIDTALLLKLAEGQQLLNGLQARLTVQGSSLPGGKPQSLVLTSNLAANSAQHTLAFNNLVLHAFGLDLNGALQVTTAPEVSLAGQLNSGPFSPKALMAALGIAPPKTHDASALTQAQFSTSLVASAQQLALNKLQIQLDQTQLTGNFAVVNFASKRLQFALHANRLDADRYLPTPVKKPNETPAETLDVKAAEVSLAALQNLNAEGSVAVDSLVVKGVKLSKAFIKLSGPPGGSKRQQVSAQLYGGQGTLLSTVGQGRGQPLALNGQLSNIAIGPLLKDFTGKDKLQGSGTVVFKLTTGGRSVAAFKRGLNGELRMDLANGLVRGFNLGKMLRDGMASLAGKNTVSGDATDFAELHFAGTFNNGVLSSDTLTAKNPFLRLQGAGQADIAAETINYLAQPSLVNTASGEGGKDQVSGIVIPVRLTGALFKPKVQIDWQLALQQKATEKLRAQYKDKEQELKTKAAKEINKALSRLFGSKPSPPSEASDAPP